MNLYLPHQWQHVQVMDIIFLRFHTGALIWTLLDRTKSLKVFVIYMV